MNNGKHGPHLANDGTISCGGKCSRTGSDSKDLWWAVNLEIESVIERIIIYGCTNCCNGHLQNFDVLVYNPTDASWDNYDKGDSNLCHHQTGRSPPILNVTCGNGQIKGEPDYPYEVTDSPDAGEHNCPCKVTNPPDVKETDCPCKVMDSPDVRENDCACKVTDAPDVEKTDCPCKDTKSPDVEKTDCPCKDTKSPDKVETNASDVLPQHSKEEWIQLLQPRLTELQNDLRLDKRNLSRWRRNYISAQTKGRVLYIWDSWELSFFVL
ncbi:Hypothetical predicted protein [Mytilus galloprovincialis]|uniref:Fucolectin tachylectin-4 pentraxin-1 domain-containing protein n=1 Tax=Mytilus galloprovincialis TaxID=29158 RepID=A0A8B6G207_MYTGA|nr:Hypothetical predicted protein [Mytilus galloprovincialis]